MTVESFSSFLAASQKLFEALDDGGCDHDAIHLIEHHFISPSRECLGEIVKDGFYLGFGSSEIEARKSEDGSTYYYIDLLSRVPILAEDADVFIVPARESVIMLALAEVHKCQYDGWGTMPKAKAP